MAKATGAQYRVAEWDEYVRVRGILERHALANRQNVWNGRPISLIVPAEPLDVLDGKAAGQQFQGPNSIPDPVYILMEDFTHVKFYRLSLRASVELFEGPFSAGFKHVDDWVPQRLVTATGPNRLPR